MAKPTFVLNADYFRLQKARATIDETVRLVWTECRLTMTELTMVMTEVLHGHASIDWKSDQRERRKAQEPPNAT
jgi:hypothetical protein